MNKEKFLAALAAMKQSVFEKTEKFMDYKLTDGTIIRYDAEKLDIGVPVLAVTAEGAIALPDGDFELEDGTKFTTVGGIVTAVTPGEAPKEEAPKEEPAAAAAMTESDAGAKAKAIVESIIKETRFEEQIKELQDKVAAFEAAEKIVKENFATQKEASEKEVANLKKTVQELFAIVEQIAGEESATPAETVKNSFSVSEFKKSYKEDLEKLATESK